MKDTCKQTSQHRRAPRVELICTGRDQPKSRIRIFQHKRVRTQEPEEEQETQKSPPSSTPSSPTKAAKNALELAVASLPTSLQPLILHFGHQIITARCKRYAKSQSCNEWKRMQNISHAPPRQQISRSLCRLVRRRTRRECPSSSNRYNKQRTLTSHLSSL